MIGRPVRPGSGPGGRVMAADCPRVGCHVPGRCLTVAAVSAPAARLGGSEMRTWSLSGRGGGDRRRADGGRARAAGARGDQGPGGRGDAAGAGRARGGSRGRRHARGARVATRSSPGPGCASRTSWRRSRTARPARSTWLTGLGARLETRDLRLEGGHSARRIVHSGDDATGAEVHRTLLAALLASGVEILDRTVALDLLAEGPRSDVPGRRAGRRRRDWLPGLGPGGQTGRGRYGARATPGRRLPTPARLAART